MDLSFKYINNTSQCAEALTKLKIHRMSRMIALEIKNLYTNIPNNEVLDLIKAKLQKGAVWDSKIQQEITELVKVTVSQSYFDSDNTYWQQGSGTPMGSLISSILAEIFLQNLDN
jgi:hypothetical protein